jgi:hypothetical protein
MPFVLLVLALLGGGLICLLAINTTLGATSFQIDRLQKLAKVQSVQVQTLQQQIAADEAPAKIWQEAYALGMRPQQQVEFLDLRTHRVDSEPGVARHQAGYSNPAGGPQPAHRKAARRHRATTAGSAR